MLLRGSQFLHRLELAGEGEVVRVEPRGAEAGFGIGQVGESHPSDRTAHACSARTPPLASDPIEKAHVARLRARWRGPIFLSPKL
jgi:hypothetical protein